MDNLRSWLLIILIVVLALMFLSQWIASSAYYQPVWNNKDSGKSLKRRSSLRKYVRNRFLFIAAMYVVWIGVYLFYPLWTAEHFDLYLFNFWPFEILGFLIATGGLFFNIYAQFQLGRNFRIGIREGEETELVCSGAYSYLRNPMYAGLLITQLGLLLLMPDTISISLMIITFLMLEIQIRQEEDHLEDLHGEKFENYRKSVPRYLPMRLIKRALGFKEKEPVQNSASVVAVSAHRIDEEKTAESSKLSSVIMAEKESPVLAAKIEEPAIIETTPEIQNELAETAESETPQHLEITKDEVPAPTPEESDDIEFEALDGEKEPDDSSGSRMESVLKKMMLKNGR